MAYRVPRTIIRRRGFTLIEIMVVVAIIVILIGIVVAVGSYVKGSSQLKQTTTTFAALEGAMQDYLKDNPEPPPTKWFVALKSDAKTAATLETLPGYKNGQILDGYGSPIVYVPSTTVNGTVKGGYFVSPGPDGRMGNAADDKDNLFSKPIAP